LNRSLQPRTSFAAVHMSDDRPIPLRLRRPVKAPEHAHKEIGGPWPRFRRIQVCRKDLPANSWQPELGVSRPGGNPMLDLHRREIVTLLGGAAIWPMAAIAQQLRKTPRIGVLLAGTPASFSTRARAFLEGLQDHGYVEGRTIAIEWRWGQDKMERLPELAAELVGLNVDAVVTGGTPAAKALKSATRTIPIVMAIIGDPVAAGLVDSIARPGGNATGFSIVAPDLSGKRLQLLKEVIPGLSSVAVMSNAANPQSQIELNEMQIAARTLGLRLQSIQISAEASLENAFETGTDARVQALIVLTDAVLYSQRGRIVALAAANRLPAMYFFREFVQEGGLVSYAPSDTDLFRRAATYVDKVLKGTKPGDLPVEQPTKFELVINLKTAKALGLDVPPTLLARADEVIE
jgi:putative tryptophan/tyrosine transport system substrate-binding protein